MASVRKRGTNVWQITIYLGKDDNGKKINHFETFIGTKTQAKTRGIELEAKIKRNTNSNGKIVNVSDMLDFWLKEIKKTVSDRTLGKYAYHVRKLKPIVGDLELYELKPLDLKQQLDKIEGLAPRTIKDLYCSLRTAFTLASTWDLVRVDMMKGIKAPKLEHKGKRLISWCMETSLSL